MNQDLFDQGLKTRREVLGADYVDAAIAMPTTSRATCKPTSRNTPGATSGTARAWTGARAACSIWPC